MRKIQLLIKALFVKIVVFKTRLFTVDWSGSARLTTRPAESEHLEGKSTTPHYLVNGNKVCENSLNKKLELEKWYSFQPKSAIIPAEDYTENKRFYCFWE